MRENNCQWRLVASLAACLLVCGSPSRATEPEHIRCSVRLALENNRILIPTELPPDERIASPIRVASNPVRLIYGTSLTQGDGNGDIVGGHFVVHYPFSHHTPVSVDMPEGLGGPAPAKNVVISRDSRFASAASGNLFGGPALLYDLMHADVLRITNETRDVYRQQTDLFWRLFKQALSGDSTAEDYIRLLSLGESYLPLRNVLESGARTLPAEKIARLAEIIDTIVMERLGVPGTPESSSPDGIDTTQSPLQVRNVKFSQDGNLYAANSGKEITIRESQSGNLITRIYPFANPYQELPPIMNMAFLRSGTNFVTWHTGVDKASLLALWDTETGYLCKQESIDLSYDQYLGTHQSLTTSPTGEYFVLSGHGKKGNTTQIWTTQLGEIGGWSQIPILLKEFAVPRHRTTLSLYRPVVFSESDFYVVGDTQGTVELYDLNYHQLKKTFEGGHSDAITGLDISADGNFIASISRSTLTVWSIDNARPAVSFLAPELENLRAVEFIPGESGRLLIQTVQGGEFRIYLITLP